MTLVGCKKEPIELYWKYSSAAPSYSTPAIDPKGMLYFGNEAGALNAIDLDGKFRWRFNQTSDIASSPTVLDDVIYFGSTNNYFYAIDKKGLEYWKFRSDQRIKSDPIIIGQNVIFSSYDGRIYALDRFKGDLQWVFPPNERRLKDAQLLPEEGVAAEDYTDVQKAMLKQYDFKPGAFSYSSPIEADGVIYAGNMDGHMYAVKAETGELLWRKKFEKQITSTPYVGEGMVYFGCHDKNIYALDAKTGKEIWKVSTQNEVWAATFFYDGILYVGSQDKHLYAIEAKTGKVKWKFPTNGPVITRANVYKNLVLFAAGHGDNHFYAIDKDTQKEFYKFKTGSQIKSDISMHKNVAYFTSGDNFIYALKINQTK